MSNNEATAKNLDPIEEDRTVCFCHNVPLCRLLEVIRAGTHTIEGVQAETCASTGCGGCELDVREILEAELKGLPKKD